MPEYLNINSFMKSKNIMGFSNPKKDKTEILYTGFPCPEHLSV